MRKKKQSIAVLLVIGVMLYAAVSLAASLRELKDAEEMTAALLQEIEAAETENSVLNEKIVDINSGKAVASSAAETFGYTDSQEIVFVDIN